MDKKNAPTNSQSAQDTNHSTEYTPLRSLAEVDAIGNRRGGFSVDYCKGGCARIFIDVAANLLTSRPMLRPTLIKLMAERTGGTPGQARKALDELTDRRVIENYIAGERAFVRMRRV